MHTGTSFLFDTVGCVFLMKIWLVSLMWAPINEPHTRMPGKSSPSGIFFSQIRDDGRTSTVVYERRTVVPGTGTGTWYRYLRVGKFLFDHLTVVF